MNKRHKAITIEYFPENSSSEELKNMDSLLADFKKQDFSIFLISNQDIPPNLQQYTDEVVFAKDQKSLLENFGLSDIANTTFNENTEQIVEKIKSKHASNLIIRSDFILSPYLEIIGEGNDDYLARFIDLDENEIIDEMYVRPGYWVKADRRWFTNWLIEVYLNDELFFVHRYDAKNKKVLISLDTPYIGQCLAWFPFLEEFRQKQGCHLIVSSFYNQFFAPNYPEIEFITPDDDSQELYAAYEIGIYPHDYNRNKNNFDKVPLQQIATDYLGLEYHEKRANLVVKEQEREIKTKYICLAGIDSSELWQQIVTAFHDKNYQIVQLGESSGDLNSIIDKTSPDITLNEQLQYLKHAALYIGKDQDLAWMAWSLEVPVITFAENIYEMPPKGKLSLPLEKLTDLTISAVTEGFESLQSSEITNNQENPAGTKSNNAVLLDKELCFYFQGKKLMLNRINIENLKEREIEIPLAFDFLVNLSNKSILAEMGDTLPVYENSLSELLGIRNRKILDKEAFTADLTEDRYSGLLALSPLFEQILPEEEQKLKPVKSLNKFLDKVNEMLLENGQALITIPLSNDNNARGLSFKKEVWLKVINHFKKTNTDIELTFFKRLAKPDKNELWQALNLKEIAELQESELSLAVIKLKKN